MVKKTGKAVALVSGGLDSMLAAKIIQDQGIYVEGINFFTGFCHSGHTSAIRKNAKPKRNDALWVAEQLGIKLHIIDVVEEYKDVLINPKYGFGKNLNPCLDCKIFMVNKAHEWINKNGFDFIITGEVIGQRPNSQLKSKMKIVSNSLQNTKILLRPLSAKNLEPTTPEIEGIVDREKLFGFTGRGRRPQIDLANKLKFKEFAQPAGGCCVLTDKSYSNKLADFWQNKGDRKYELDDIILLKVGRHFRISKNLKIIVSRDEGENRFLQGYRYRYQSLQISNGLGALGIIYGDPDESEMLIASRIIARFSKHNDANEVEVALRDTSGQNSYLNVKPFKQEDIMEQWYL